MKLAFIPLVTTLALLLSVGCAELPGIDTQFRDLTMTGPDGAMKLKAVYDNSSKDVPGCSGVICHTDGKDVFTNIWLSFYFYDNTPQGSELKLERLSFGALLSSNSREYTSTFSGKMTLGEKTDSYVIVYLEDVHFKIQHGEYVLNGNLIAKTK